MNQSSELNKFCYRLSKLFIYNYKYNLTIAVVLSNRPHFIAVCNFTYYIDLNINK